MAPYPGSDADYIKDKARRDLLTLLEGVRGKKNLVISQNLAGPVGIFVKFSQLQEYGVDRVFLLENANIDSSQRNVVFLIHAEKIRQVQTAAEQIKRLQQNGNVEHEFSIFWVPRRTFVSNKVLEDAGIIGDVNIAEFPLYFVPLEQDVLSLELDDCFGDLYLHKDPGCIFLAAKALMDIQQRQGYFPRIIGKGDHARRLADLLLRMRKELDAEESSGLADPSARGLLPSANTESLIIIDREVDFGTPLLTQLTYEGLIDEFVGIKNNQADVDTAVVGANSVPQAQESSKAPQQTLKQGQKRKIQLDSSDQLFSQVRDANFAIVGDILNKVARRLESEYETRHAAKTPSELREFVNKLPTYQLEHQSLRVHTNLAQEIMRNTRSDIFRKVLEVQQNHAAGTDPTYQHDAIKELIARDVPLKTVLRLLCLESCMAGGLRSRDLENFKKQIVHAYGHQHILTFSALEKMELLQPRSSAAAMLIPTAGAQPGTKTNYNYLRKNLRLLVEEVSEKDPNDIAYVYSGFAPLSIRLVQCVLQKPYIFSLVKGGAASATSTPASTASPGWLGFEDVVKSARGATFSIVQKGDDKAVRARQTLSGNNATKTVYVFLLGGATFTEIAALRFIAAQEAPRRRIVICTTSIINGDRMMEAAIEKGSFAKTEG
ncbi:vacuolar protein sorting-associated protein 33A [Aspergillus lentulus]|uniref:Vacuolar protein sorting-associated protein 33A n=1 Tax=Aspergillus lentulus TaxID=293939 RepID=A0ABQ0ZX30_ASPLE|nr:vacuolar protein sorting-associated protein 33A [Aspergillus lentulus]GFF28230.1 vacuolar protein sorting-associated protein 33A [Aspergillus lentulus]GFF67781.1 vacuolar protein sorting-associated protein 33A [Aspergillus lentulus]GFG05683.1 vacuolar protein sorting-associated protein 33A [Aspergillus lentulus]